MWCSCPASSNSVTIFWPMMLPTSCSPRNSERLSYEGCSTRLCFRPCGSGRALLICAASAKRGLVHGSVFRCTTGICSLASVDRIRQPLCSVALRPKAAPVKPDIDEPGREIRSRQIFQNSSPPDRQCLAHQRHTPSACWNL
jgi:hypothetical protein